MGGYNFENLIVLVVDDNKHMRRVVKTILQALGVSRIAQAADGNEALDELRVGAADMVVCDLQMGPMDGIEFVRTVRNDPESPNPYIPIIILSGFTELSRIKEARDAGMNEFLAKPISVATLYGRMAEIIENPRPFVRTVDFFGPDRRRWDDPNYKGPERRADEAARDASDEQDIFDDTAPIADYPADRA